MDRMNGASFFSAEGSLSRLRTRKGICAMNMFLRSPRFVLLVASLAALSSLFRLELPVYTAYVAVALYVCLLGDDLLPIMPLTVCCYIAPSPSNNPGRNEGSVFYGPNGGYYLLTLAGILVVFLVIRLVTDPDFGGIGFLKAKRALLPGMLLLGGAYLLSGLGMKNYAEVFGNNLLFAFIQFVSVSGLYFLFTGAVKWERAPKDYLAWTAMTAGLVVLLQLLENYVGGRAFMDGTGTIDRELMHTGWGMHNNIGLMISMCMPFAFYLSTRSRRGWAFAVVGAVLLAGVVASCSRTSMVVAAAAFVLCVGILRRGSGDKKLLLRVLLIMAAVAAVVAVVLWDKLIVIFRLFFDELLIISSRDKLFVNGMKQFFRFPVFGGSFYPQMEYVPWDWSDLEAFTSFFPPRWHCTLVQIGASCGVVGLAAYVYHRIQTVQLFLKERTPEKTFIAISLAVLLICGLLDCHFFNVGPVLFYSMALAFAENIGKSELE